ncbi:MAG: pimeloyl-ACP methyl ester carboxylesterase, partial [Saprospiraceae bacterium]
TFDKPTLFIKGGNSKHIQAEYQAQILEKFPEAVVKTIENAGHWVHADQPEALLQMVREWFL